MTDTQPTVLTEGESFPLDAYRDFEVLSIGSDEVRGIIHAKNKQGKRLSPKPATFHRADLERVLSKGLYTEGVMSSPDGATLSITRVDFPFYIVEATEGQQTNKGQWTHAQVTTWRKKHMQPVPAEAQPEPTSDPLELKPGRKLDLHGHPVTIGFVSPASIQIISAVNESIRHLDRESLEQYLKDGYFKVESVLANNNDESVDYATVLSRIGDIYTVKLLTPGAESTESWTGRALVDWLFSEPEPNPMAEVEFATEDTASLLDKIATLTRELETARAERDAAIAQRDDKAEALAQSRKTIEWHREELAELKAAEGDLTYTLKIEKRVTESQLNDFEGKGWIRLHWQFNNDGDLFAIYQVPMTSPAPKGNGLDKAIESAEPAVVENGLLKATSAQAELRAAIVQQNRAIHTVMVEAAVKRAAQLGITEVYHAAQ